jgi:carboxyl-terminal processing protease
MKKLLTPILIVVLATAIFGGGFWLGKNSQPSVEKVTGLQNLETGKPVDVDFSLFWDAWAEVQKKYVDRTRIDYQKMVYGAISGMLEALNDPYTSFMTPEENKEFEATMEGSLEGIGAEVGMRKDIVTIISPLENSPAKKAGLLAGDKILKVDDKIISGLSIDEAVALIRGPRGTQVSLTILRDGWEEAKEFKIIRAVINIPIVKLEMKEISPGKTAAYLALYHFTENSVSEFTRAAQQVLTSGAEGIILDLRNNPGGYLESAVEIASWFLPENDLIVVEDYGDGKKIEHRSSGTDMLGSFKVIVLINQGSASASEILAGALRDNKGVQLVGEKSYGKGSVQELSQMRGGTSLKITVAKWLTPSGHSIMDEGLEPDVMVELTLDDFNNSRDPQLEKALEMLK